MKKQGANITIEDYLKEKEDIFEFKGVKITKDLIDNLQSNQENNFAIIREYKSDINELIHYLMRPLIGLDQKEDKTLEHMANLSRIKEFLDSCETVY